MIGPLPYIGGKRRLAPKLIRLIPNHKTYVEPFAGGAQLLFHKKPSSVEILNDLDGEVVNFLRVCKYHAAELTRSLRFMPPSRELFRILSQAQDGLTDIQRAANFFYLQKNSFGGNRVRRTFHYCVEKAPNFNWSRLGGLLKSTAERLASVQIERLPYERVLTKYDRPTTFFYLDPPYVGVTRYAHNLADGEFVKLARLLRRLTGRFILSINDHPLAKAAFHGFDCTQVELSYTGARTVPKVKELLISNFPLPNLTE